MAWTRRYRSLFDQFYRQEDWPDLPDRMARIWSQIRKEPPSAETATLCRMAMQACARQQEYDLAFVWRARSLRLSVEAGWPNGVAAILVSEAFSILRGKLHSPPARVEAALQVIEEMKPLLEIATSSDVGPSPSVLRRLYHEKRGFLLFLLGRYSEAERAYTRAARFCDEDERGRLKVIGGRALVRYLRDPSGVGRDRALRETTQIIEQARAGSWLDVLEPAITNHRRIKRGSANLVPYETL
jgi:hypothetical protein